MRGEYRCAALNLSNTTPGPLEARLSFEGLPESPTPGYIDVHEVLFTDTQSGVPIAAALPQLAVKNGVFSVQIVSGMTKQIWLTFHPNDKFKPGTYRGRLVIEPHGLTVPVELRVYPFDFPTRPTLHLGGWDYTNLQQGRDVTPQNRAALVRHLQDRYVDAPWATNQVLPRGKFDADGNLVQQPSVKPLKDWIELWPDARWYCVFAAVSNRFEQFEQGTPAFQRAVAQWIQFWCAQLEQLGVSPSQLALLLIDEPHQHEQGETIVHYARVIREAAPEIAIWEDPTWTRPWEAGEQLFASSDILCPNMPMWIEQGKPFAEFYERQREAGRQLWFYSCSGPGKLLDPYAYHRMQPWFCWKYGARASCYWSFSDASGATTWNEYLARAAPTLPCFWHPIP